MLSSRRAGLMVAAFITSSIFSACYHESTGDSSDSVVCALGEVRPCTCIEGSAGVQQCGADASFGVCGACDDAATTGSSAPTTGDAESDADSDDGAETICGDAICDPWEGCEDCPEDCGVCEMCEQAPSCAGNIQPPEIDESIDELTIDMGLMNATEILADISAKVERGDAAVRLLVHALAPPRSGEPTQVTTLRAAFEVRADFRQRFTDALHHAGMLDLTDYRERHPLQLEPTLRRPPTSALTACANPRLRIRVASITAYEDYDDVANDIIYCAIVTEAETQSEIRVLSPTIELDEGAKYEYSVAEGIIWGADNQFVPPGGNMHITYNCFESDTGDGFDQLAELIGGLVEGVDGIPIPGAGGWTVPGSSLAELLMQIAAWDGDDHLLNASQTINQSLLLTLTQGRYWNVRRSGEGSLWAWDWELRMEAWGCTDDGVL